MTIIDLTMPITPHMPVYPGDPEVQFERCPNTVTGGFTVHAITMGTHTGTHIDTPAHISGSRGTDDTAVLAASTGMATRIKVAVTAGDEITPNHLGADINQIHKGSRILLQTGWSQHIGDSDYFTSYPSVSLALAEFLVSSEISLLGLDTPSVHTKYSHEVHTCLLNAGIVVVENLTNLQAVPRNTFMFVASPLPFKGLDGSPVRALAILQ